MNKWTPTPSSSKLTKPRDLKVLKWFTIGLWLGAFYLALIIIAIT